MPSAGSHALQGERSYMEDRVVACTVEGCRNVSPFMHQAVEGERIGIFAGVFDGHSGDTAAEFCAEWLLGTATRLFGEGQYEKALSAAFIATNDAFLVGPKADDSGCTACCVLLINGQLFVANCGDSRAVLLGADAAPLQLTVDHKPDDEQECERVEAAGGSIFDAEDGNGARVVGPKVENGDYLMLGVARSIGDRPFKATDPPLVPATPDVTRHDVSALGAKFVIVASDGVASSARRAVLAVAEPADRAKPVVLLAADPG
jgi:serine/threonine protein phosphatase PrpC